MCNCSDNINQSEVPSGPMGPAGTNGADGVDSFGVTTGIATSLGSNSYSIPMSGNNNKWITAGQIIYIQSSGYFLVTAVTIGTNTTITDLLYPGNTVVPILNSSSLKVVSGGLQGLTGSTGSQGPSGNVFSFFSATNTNIPIQTDIPVIPVLSGGSKMTCEATLFFDSTAAITITITPRMGGTDLTTKVIKSTSSTAISGHSYAVISYIDLNSIVPGQSFVLRITLDDYTKSTIVNTNFKYIYQ